MAQYEVSILEKHPSCGHEQANKKALEGWMARLNSPILDCRDSVQGKLDEGQKVWWTFWPPHAWHGFITHCHPIQRMTLNSWGMVRKLGWEQGGTIQSPDVLLRQAGNMPEDCEADRDTENPRSYTSLMAPSKGWLYLLLISRVISKSSWKICKCL